MSKIRGDPMAMALSHPTRRDVYNILLGVSEMATVAIQNAIGVNRYNLYHHLDSLKKVELVENHRDEGRTRWWRVAKRVDGLEISTKNLQVQNAPNFTALPAEIQQAVEGMIATGAEAHVIHSAGDIMNGIRIKLLLKEAAELWDDDFELPMTFDPQTILVIGSPRK